MINIFKDYLKATDIVVRSVNDIFDKLEGMTPHLHIISDERKEEFINEIEKIMTHEVTSVLYLTGLNKSLLKRSIFRGLKHKIALKCYAGTNTTRKQQMNKGVGRLRSSGLSAKSIRAALNILAEASDRSEKVIDEILDEFEEKVFGR